MCSRWSLTLAGAFVVLTSTLAHAQASQTFVSGVGDDLNPCSRLLPCKTFAGAISKTLANGEINVLDPGGYGAVTITKPIAIISDGPTAGVIVGGPTDAIIINIPNPAARDAVFLRGLDINGLGSARRGISIRSAGAVHIDNCIIYGFTSNGIEAAQANANALLFVRNTLTYNTRAGLVVGQTVNATVENLRSVRNLYGVQGINSGEIHIRDSVLSSNTFHGIVTIGAAHAIVENTTIGFNGDTGAVASGGTANVRLGGNTITGNTLGIAGLGSGQLISFGDNDIGGNTTNGTPTSTVPRI